MRDPLFGALPHLVIIDDAFQAVYLRDVAVRTKREFNDVPLEPLVTLLHLFRFWIGGISLDTRGGMFISRADTERCCEGIVGCH